MASNESCSCTDSSAKDKNNQIFSKSPCVLCNCDWELNIGYGVAVGFAILEIKRLFLLALEMIIEFSVLQFSGAIKSVIISFIDVALGFPCALAAIYSIRKRQKQPCYSKVKILLKCVGLIIVICAILNMVTLASIGYHINVRQNNVENLFNSSMHLYATNESYKFNLDEIQFEFQCCGHSNYADWFLFDWQRLDSLSREEINPQRKISDEEFRDRGVPFSCCNIHSLMPCAHIQMTEADVKTINIHGCSKILNYVLIRIVVFGYIMTTLVIISQAVLFYFIVKITRKPLPQECPSDCSCLSSGDSSPRCPLMEPSSPCSYSSSSESLSVGDERPFPIGKRNSKIMQISRKSSIYWRNNGLEKMNKLRSQISTSCSSLSDISSLESYTKRDTARIRPSTHKQHQISQKQSCRSLLK